MDNLLKPLSPLGHDTTHSVVIGPVTITENTGVALASLASRLGQEKLVAKAAKTAGIPQPGPGASTTDAVYGAFWLGPEQWMIEAPFVSHEDIVSILKPVFGEAASLTEQTDAWVRFDLEGADLPRLFERLCGYDLRASGAGAATRTMIEHLGCYVVLRQKGSPADTVSVYGPRSSAHSLHHALITAAKSAF